MTSGGLAGSRQDQWPGRTSSGCGGEEDIRPGERSRRDDEFEAPSAGLEWGVGSQASSDAACGGAMIVSMSAVNDLWPAALLWRRPGKGTEAISQKRSKTVPAPTHY